MSTWLVTWWLRFYGDPFVASTRILGTQNLIPIAPIFYLFMDNCNKPTVRFLIVQFLQYYHYIFASVQAFIVLLTAREEL